ncbi:MAG TPA: bifunctional polysaccharide deacetylase/glycosyltransferase family 2 protein, partial [Conexibacter sp.]|nr:bifunctional polysaccharide deacetylase/glycosyltransferase family 2 protein [Conexibacter sp.]
RGSPAAAPAPRAGNPPGHRLILGFCVGVLVLLLLVEGFTTKTVGQSGTGSGAPVASPIAGQRPVLEAGPGGTLRSRMPPFGRRVALTFDDGPSPDWTPRIIAVLRRLHVPATFFLVGSQAVRNPGIVREEHRLGFELGNHTFTHADLAALPAWERDEQVAMTESAISGIAGVRPRLVRPPYSATPAGALPSEVRAWAEIARRGYAIALSTYNTEDWSQPGVGAIVAAATPPGDQGGIVMLHDAGGRRAQTVAALERLIPRLRARGFRFTTVSQLAGIPRAQAEVPASGWARTRGRLLVAMLRIAAWVTNALTLVVFAITALAAARMGFVLLVAHLHVRRGRRRAGEAAPFLPGVSIVVPAHDEAVGIERAVRSLADSDYPAGCLEMIVVDDGSTDGTAEIVERLGLPRVRLLRQANQGKPVALNRGAAAARHAFLVTVDGDTVFEPGTLRALVAPFRDPQVGAVSGNTKVGNRGSLLGRWQHVEYVMGFNLDRRVYEMLDCMPTVPGAIGAFRRQALVDAGGISGATLAEDTDVTLAIGRAGWRVVYAADARAWTEVPSTLRGLWRQRYRWAYGTIQSTWKHRAALLDPRGRRAGRRAIPYLALFQVLFPLAAPLIDLFAIYSVAFLDPFPILGFWLAFNALQMVLAWAAFGYDGESRRPLWTLPLQQLVYRQLMYLVVIESIVTALLGSRLHWHRVARTGDVEVGARAAG